MQLLHQEFGDAEMLSCLSGYDLVQNFTKRSKTRFIARRYRACVLNNLVNSQMDQANQINVALAGGATLIACAFALSTYDRWHRRGNPQEFAWTIAMTLFAVGSGALWLAESIGWSIFVFRIFFLAGAVLNVAWLALGTIYLLANKKLGDQIRNTLVVLTAFSVGVIVVAPTKRNLIEGEFPAARELFGVLPRMMAAIGSGVPALVIIAGALWSTWRVLKSQPVNLNESKPRVATSPRRLALGNVLIASGTIVLSASGTLAGRLGKDRAFAVTLLVGLCVLFLGFLVASNSTRKGEKELSPND